MIDLAVIGAVALGAFAGWRRGFVMPLVAVGTSLVGLYALYAGPGAGTVPAGTAGIGLGVLLITIAGSLVGRLGGALASLVARVGVLKAADHTLGLPLGAATALVGVYVALAALVSFDNVLAPLHGRATVDQAAVAALRATLAANPQFAVMIDPNMLDAMASEVATAAMPADQIAKFDAALGFYVTTVRPALVGSAIAPILLAVGERAPFVGRHVEFPAK
ncbi:MAG TPA: CvpA family protein [Candidatus Limnocylindria bacterium]|nr:CvpA family protein [Candidatus Limnocylindria bacterium]